MEIYVTDILTNSPTLLTFLVIGIGYLIGNIRISPIDIGSTTGVLVTGLLLGHLGFPSSSAASTFGFALFIFSVGIQAGPGFFSALAEDGRKYVALAVVVSVSALALAITFSKLFQFEFGFNAGLMAGALTSTPTLAGAQDAYPVDLPNCRMV